MISLAFIYTTQRKREIKRERKRVCVCLKKGKNEGESVKGIKGDVDKSPTTTRFHGRAVRLVAFWCKD